MKHIFHKVKHHATKVLQINKVLLIIIVAIILGFGAIVFFLNSRLETIFSYVPKHVSQVFVIRASDNNNILYQNYTQEITANFQQTLKQIEIAVIAQKTIDKIQENLIFVQAKTDFNPQTLLDAINSDAEISYIYQKLGGSLYVFGKPEALKYIKADPTDNFFAYKKLKAYTSLLKNADVSFFSRVESTTIDVTQMSPFLQNLDYFVYGLQTQKKGLSMEANLVYKNARQPNTSYTFTPKLDSYLNDKSLFFLELGSVIQQLNVKKEDFVAGLTYFFTSQGMTNFTQQEYETFYKSLNDNLGIGIGEGNNLLGIGLFVIFKNPDLFGVLSKLVSPIYTQLIALPLMSGFDVSLVQETDKQGFSSLVGGIQEVGLYTQKNKDSTVITLGDPEIVSASSPIKIDYTKHTLGYFYANFDNIISLYKKFGGSVGLADNDQFAFFEKKILRGQIISDADRIQVKAVIE